MQWLTEAASQDPGCEVFHIPRSIFGPVWRHLCWHYAESPKDTDFGESSLDVYYAPQYAESRQRFREYCADVMSYVRDRYGVDVWCLPKMNDDWIVDLIMSLKELGTPPVMVDDREGQMIPRRLEVYPSVLKNYIKDFEVDLLCTHNETHREFWIRSGHDPSKIALVGRPDTDYWSRPDTWKSRKQIHPQLADDKFLVLYFSFGRKSAINFYWGSDPGTWDSLGDDFHEVLLNLLKQYHGKIQIVYKSSAKEARDRYSKSNAFFAKEAKRFVDDGSLLPLGKQHKPHDLMRHADAIMGFQTSGLIEAMFTDTPIVYGAWGEFYHDIKDGLHPFHKTGALLYARSKEEMERYIRSLIEGEKQYAPTEEMLQLRKEFRERYYYNADGHVSQRVLDHAKRLSNGKA
jgi:glycosyltransferase involved in cell wall biosynthesis